MTVTQATPADSSMHDVLEQARALVPTLRDRAAATEERRSLLPETVADMKAAGIFRITQPRTWGGLELGFDALADAAYELGRGDGSAGWVSVVLNGGWFLASFPEQAAADVWGKDGSILVGGVLAPSPTVSRVDGGWTISGRWPYSSGIDHCSWNIVSCFEFREGGPPDARLFLVPASDYTVEDTWFTLGLRGTGSKTTVIKDVFVPEHRTLLLGDLREGRGPGTAVNTNPFYRVPFGIFFSLSIASPIAGAAQGGLELWRETSRDRRAPDGSRVTDQPTLRAIYAESAAEIDCARLLLRRDFDDALEMVQAGHIPTSEERARSWRDGAYAVRLCERALDRLFEAAGGRVLQEGDPFQRTWRDVHTASSHIAMRWVDAADRFGRMDFGYGPPNPFFH
ncbi:MAG: acyl-CoA dehydrogenase family protein [Candidatus Dormibacteraeota bacterium]|nr:acyl-CoA dehydrogenase family protein [Candidatus Dormibacteraeota bacterium]MBV9525186.1 acyl-CoA dehydrogenase family protein [Candidatus Dormibacteraeota bacterium]